jgi:hypothetical protein
MLWTNAFIFDYAAEPASTVLAAAACNQLEKQGKSQQSAGWLCTRYRQTNYCTLHKGKQTTADTKLRHVIYYMAEHILVPRDAFLRDLGTG